MKNSRVEKLITIYHTVTVSMSIFTLNFLSVRKAIEKKSIILWINKPWKIAGITLWESNGYFLDRQMWNQIVCNFVHWIKSSSECMTEGRTSIGRSLRSHRYFSIFISSSPSSPSKVHIFALSLFVCLVVDVSTFNPVIDIKENLSFRFTSRLKVTSTDQPRK